MGGDIIKNNRGNISYTIKREVRQRCYFRCVICGNPIIEYHHIIPWHIVKKHESDNITLLCSNCHSKVGKKLISDQEVIEHNNNPYNKNRNYSPSEMLGYRIFDRKDVQELEIVIGNSSFKLQPLDIYSLNYIMIPVMIDKEPIIAFTIIEGKLNLYLRVYDEDNVLAIEIINNEIITRLDFWDITFIGNTLKINRGSHKVFMEIQFNVPFSIHIKSGFLMYNKKGLRVHPKLIETLGSQNRISNNTFINILVGISIGLTPENMNIGIAIVE